MDQHSVRGGRGGEDVRTERRGNEEEEEEEETKEEERVKY